MLIFSNQFFYCNILIAAFICIIAAVKRILKNYLSQRIQYDLWFLILILMAVPFIPVRFVGFVGFPQLLSWFVSLSSTPSGTTGDLSQITTAMTANDTRNWMNDFAISVSRNTASVFSYIFAAIWLTGILTMLVLTFKSVLRFRQIEKSALPLQSKRVYSLFIDCRREMKIQKNIPVYSTAFIKSPMITGIIKPRIYLPIHLISDYNAKDMRYMLLHELQHYKHHDSLVNFIINLAGIFYWFNPFVWYALREMRSDKEIACDSSVLEMLNEEDYEDYGNTLINFAEKISLSPFPFSSGMGGSMEQIKKRILNIASYQPQSFKKKLQGTAAFCFISVILLGLAPVLSVYAANAEYYQFQENEKEISYIDLSAHFLDFDGSFVLFDSATDTWQIYNKEYAVLRFAPDSTYKIYDALLGLEAGIIEPAQSQMVWDGEDYPFEAWNTDQDLNSAMENSVNWYFQNIDQQAGSEIIREHIKQIGYGNQDLSGNLSSYWLESSLKISPVEQVELLVKLQDNEFPFKPSNITAVKNSIRLYSSEQGTFYGKTGTGRINGNDVNGWFIGFIEKSGHTYYFAINIQSDEEADGSNASEIALSILSDMGIWK